MRNRSKFMVVLGFIFLLGCSIPALGQVSVSVAQLKSAISSSALTGWFWEMD